jgi:tRNA U38,U39,U40 pseudouridine synthase TruA
LAKHRSYKFAVDIPYQIKQNVYEHMIDCLKYLKERESAYREAVDNANSFMQGEFREMMEQLASALLPNPAHVKELLDKANQELAQNKGPPKELPLLDLGIEGNRCEAVHEAINKFVVYEKFAEMTHKYDV